MIYLIYTFLAVIIGGVAFAIYAIKFVFNLKHNDSFAYQNPPFIIHEEHKVRDYMNSFRFIDRYDYDKYPFANHHKETIIGNESYCKWEIQRMTQKIAQELLRDGVFEIWEEKLPYEVERKVFVKLKVVAK